MEEKQEIKSIYLENQKIEYILIRKKIKNIYLNIKDNKLFVKANKRVPIYYIETLLKTKKNWIVKKLNENTVKQEREKLYTDKEFENIIIEYIEKYSKLLNVNFNKVRIKSIKYAWGSCTSNKNITINYELIKYEKDIIEYVVVHELCHLKYMNHSNKFWDLVKKYIPEYKIIRKKLKNS